MSSMTGTYLNGGGGRFGGRGGTNQFLEARRRLQEDMDRQQLIWDRQRVAGQHAVAFAPTAHAQRMAQMQLDINADSFVTARRRAQADLAQLDAQHRAGQTMGRMALAGQAAGAVVGAARSYYSGNLEEMLGQYERRMSLMAPNWRGTAGDRAKAFGYQLKGAGTLMWGTSNADVFGGSMAIAQQTPQLYWNRQLAQASSAAYLTPGLGIQGAAQMQQELGTAQSFYAAQMFGMQPTRFAGGRQNESAALMLSLANRVNAGNFGSLTASQLQSQFAQGGSLSMSLANFGRQAGLSGQTMEAMQNQAYLLRDLMNPEKEGLQKMSRETALSVIRHAGERGEGGDAARELIRRYAPSVGGSYEDTQRYLKGLDREGHLPGSASFLDAAKASADTLVDIKEFLQKTFGWIQPMVGTLGGSFKGGGITGTIGSAVEGMWGGFKSGLKEGWNWGMPSWARIGGGDSGTPESKQGGKGKKKDEGGKGLPSGNISKVLEFARSHVGDDYVWGAEGPHAWDCSSFVQAAYASIGVSLPRITQDQINAGIKVSMDDLQPGDLLFYGGAAPTHVGLYAGGGNVIEAANPGRGVVTGPMYSKFVQARRVVGGGSLATTRSQSGKSDKDPTSPSAMRSGVGGAGAYGSVEEVDALAAALAGGGGGGTVQSGRTPSESQGKEAKDETDLGSFSGGGDAAANMELGKKMAAAMGWTGKEWDALKQLWINESGWKSDADNPTSDAYGIPQAMSNLYPETATKEWRGSPAKQIAWGLKYIKDRYGSPSKAWSFWNAQSPNWYDRGAWEIQTDQDARVHAGEMILSKAQATTVRQALLEQGLGESRTGGGGGGVVIDMGGVTINMPSATAEGAQSAARQFVDYVSADDRVKSLMGGW
ncbi:C40 family peptidase [Streptomyces roseifaciens]